MQHAINADGRPVQIELVGEDGMPLLDQPVTIEDLLQQEDHMLPIGNGLSLLLEKAQGDGKEDGSTTAEDSASDKSHEEECAESTTIDGSEEQTEVAPPPGTSPANDWYAVLRALQRHGGKGHDTAPPGPREGRQATRSSATPLKRFLSTSRRAAELDAATATRPPSGLSRREVWSSFVPPADRERDYRRLQYVSVMSEPANLRRFRPMALSFHAMTSYLNANDKGQRILVYGGTSTVGRAIERELFEFSLLTGYWTRIEGKQLTPAGHVGHSMIVAEAANRLVVVGGIGPGGIAVQDRFFTLDSWHETRASLLSALGLKKDDQQLQRGEASAAGAELQHPQVAAATSVSASMPPVVGFVSFLFDMDLSTQRWRAVRTLEPIHLVFHSAVAFKDEIYIFGGVNEELSVSGELLIVRVGTYTVRRATSKRRRSSSSKEDAVPAPPPRYLHTAVRYGCYMILYGGFNAENEPLSDTWAYDLLNERWEELSCRGGGNDPRAGHAACVVGCRMLVTGGVESMLHTSMTPSASVLELNLIPNAMGEYTWRSEAKVSPALPPIAFAASVACGDGASCLLYGGLTVRPKVHRATSVSASRENGGSRASSSPPKGVGGPLVPRRGYRYPSGENAMGKGERDMEDSPPHGLLDRLATLDDSLLLTFPFKPRKAADDGQSPRVNALGVEVDPTALPEHFLAFVRRQEDFLKKKEASVNEVKRRVTLEEAENMEPALHLTDEEIEQLLEKSNTCCDAFSEFKMDTLPGNVPDREGRTRIVEECVSLSKQLRDVLKSMKGSSAGVTAVRSKQHRQRGGQKFEDYSAAKPFRRVVVQKLMHAINEELARMHKLNKALRTVDWEEKNEFIERVRSAQEDVNELTRTVNRIVNKYIQRRVDILMKGADQHKETMRLLTEVVTQNRHDAIFQSNLPDKQRERVKRMWMNGAQPEATGGVRRKRGTSGGREKGISTPQRGGSRRRHLTEAGLTAAEENARITVSDNEWALLKEYTEKVKQRARMLSDYCTSCMSTIPTTTAATAAASPSAAEDSNAPPPAPATSSATPPNSLLLPPPLVGQTPANLVAPPSASPPPPPPPPVAADASADVAAQAPTVSGGETAQAAVIRRSDALRRKTAEAANAVEEALQAFALVLDAPPQESTDTSHQRDGPPSPATSDKNVAAVDSPSRSEGHAENQSASFSSSLDHSVKPAGVTAHQTEESTTAHQHVLLYRSLRPVLQSKSKLDRAAEKVAGIRQNEWEASNNAGAPQDVQAEKLCRRLGVSLSALLQRLTASFLTRAGARGTSEIIQPTTADPSTARGRSKSRRQRRSTVTVAAPPPASQREGSAENDDCRARESFAKNSKGDRSYSQDASQGDENDGGSSNDGRQVEPLEARDASARQSLTTLGDVGHTHGAPASAIILPAVALAPCTGAVDLASLVTDPQAKRCAQEEHAVHSLNGLSSASHAAVPLVPPQAFDQLRGTASAEDDGASSPDTKCAPSVVPASPDVQQVSNYFVPSTENSQKEPSPAVVAAAQTWPGVPSGTPQPQAAAPSSLCGITLADGPAVRQQPVAPRASVSLGNASSRSEHDALPRQQPQRSVIVELTQMGGEAGAYREQPLTSIIPGGFQADPVSQCNIEISTTSTASPFNQLHASSALDDESDYFFFGRGMVQARLSHDAREAPPQQTELHHRPLSTRGSRRPYVVRTSPPVGSTLPSQRVSASLQPTKRAAPHHDTACGMTKRYDTSHATLMQKPESSKVRSASRKRLTPGERQILEAKERLRRR